MRKLKIQTLIMLAVMATVSIFFSCRKMLTEIPEDPFPLSLEKDFTVETAKDYFNENLENTLIANPKTARAVQREQKAFSGRYDINWARAKNFRRGRFEMVEVPIWFQHRRLTMYSFEGNQGPAASTEAMATASVHKLLIYRTKQGRVISRILTFIPDKAYIAKYGMDVSKNGSDHLEKNFSGYVEFRTLKQQKILFVYRIKAGKAVKRIKLGARHKAEISARTLSTASSTCPDICEPIWDLDCYQGDPNPESSTGYDVICENKIVGENCYPDFCLPDPDPDPCLDPANYNLPECGYEPDPCIDYGLCDPEDPEEPEPEPAPDPCAKARSMEADTSFKSKMNTLKGKTSENYEAGYVKISGQPAIYQTGTPGDLTFPVPSVSQLANQSLEYIAHSHNTDPLALSIFGFADLFMYAQYVHSSKVVNPNTFTMSVTTGYGTSYALVLEDATKFSAFYNTYCSNAIGGNALKSLIDANVKETNSKEVNEKKFLSILSNLNSGIKLLKANSDFTDWSKLSHNSNNDSVIVENCNN